MERPNNRSRVWAIRTDNGDREVTTPLPRGCQNMEWIRTPAKFGLKPPTTSQKEFYRESHLPPFFSQDPEILEQQDTRRVRLENQVAILNPFTELILHKNPAEGLPPGVWGRIRGRVRPKDEVLWGLPVERGRRPSGGRCCGWTACTGSLPRPRATNHPSLGAGRGVRLSCWEPASLFSAPRNPSNHHLTWILPGVEIWGGGCVERRAAISKSAAEPPFAVEGGGGCVIVKGPGPVRLGSCAGRGPTHPPPKSTAL